MQRRFLFTIVEFVIKYMIGRENPYGLLEHQMLPIHVHWQQVCNSHSASAIDQQIACRHILQIEVFGLRKFPCTGFN